jgi:MoxR-like ATPase
MTPNNPDPVPGERIAAHVSGTMTPSSLNSVREHIASHVIGQQNLIDAMLVCLLSDGHLLVEGMPGLAKTTAVNALSQAIEGDFHRIQFTPDLLPSDLVGTDIYRHEKAEFEFRPGPLFHNILLADEVNRAPAKVQAALLEAMGERQITVGHKTYPLPQLFMVLATQNPVEQEGTYHLPEAQLDRFLMQVVVDYPNHAEELKILELDNDRQRELPKPPASPLPQKELFAMRATVAELFINPKLYRYIVDLIQATRKPQNYDKDLARCARARAWLNGEPYVSPEHIQEIAPDILRHRLLLTFEAEAEGITSDDLIQRLLSLVAIP